MNKKQGLKATLKRVSTTTTTTTTTNPLTKKWINNNYTTSHYCYHSRLCYSTSSTSNSGGKNLAFDGSTVAKLRKKIEEVEVERTKLYSELEKHHEIGKSNILILGTGRSSDACIDYLLESAPEKGFFVRVGDADVDTAKVKIKNSPHGTAFQYDGSSKEQREDEIAKADIVISLLPVTHHFDVAQTCIKYGKSLATASYITDQIKSLNDDAVKAGSLIMMECGLDPGIDHMSAMRVIGSIKKEGGELKSFQSFTGGLVAPESDNNPWNYKITWNPRNVVLAGTGVSKFRQNGKYKYIPYHRTFSRLETLKVPEAGIFEGFANRDSLKYIKEYGIGDCPTVFRGTLRRPGFSKAWDIFVQLGMTDDTYKMEGTEEMTNRDFINSFLLYRKHDSVELKLAYHCNISMDSPEMQKLKWLGIFEDKKIGIKGNATPAQILQTIIEKKWQFKKGDLDMIVMYNHFIYEDTVGDTHEVTSSMVTKGTEKLTAMARTVGLPLGIVARLMAENKITETGVKMPNFEQVYNPVLDELAQRGVKFSFTDRVISVITLSEYAKY